MASPAPTKNLRSTSRRSARRRSPPPPPSQRSRTHDITPKKAIKSSIASDQRAIFDWYEERQYRYDAGLIFSREWQCRLDNYRTGSNSDVDDVHERLAQLEQNPENLEIGLFFVAHSVAAFSLWHLLHACYELDKRICVLSMSQDEELAEWQNWRPLQYLLSNHIVSTWEANLSTVSSRVKQSADILQKEALGSHLFVIAEGVQNLEEALSVLTSVFEERRENMPCSYWMLQLIREGKHMNDLLVFPFTSDLSVGGFRIRLKGEKKPLCCKAVARVDLRLDEDYSTTQREAVS